MRNLPPTPPRRTLFTDERGHGLRVSWHPEREMIVLSMWRQDVCVGTFQMPPQTMRDLHAFLDGHLEAEADTDAERRAG